MLMGDNCTAAAGSDWAAPPWSVQKSHHCPHCYWVLALDGLQPCRTLGLTVSAEIWGDVPSQTHHQCVQVSIYLQQFVGLGPKSLMVSNFTCASNCSKALLILSICCSDCSKGYCVFVLIPVSWGNNCTWDFFHKKFKKYIPRILHLNGNSCCFTHKHSTNFFNIFSL